MSSRDTDHHTACLGFVSGVFIIKIGCLACYMQMTFAVSVSPGLAAQLFSGSVVATPFRCRLTDALNAVRVIIYCPFMKHF